MSPFPTLAAAVGARVREARRAAGRSQDELAAAARAVGLDWTRGAIASLETGRRDLSATELLLLPAVLRLVTGEAWALADLVDADEQVELTPGSLCDGQLLRQTLAGDYGLPTGAHPPGEGDGPAAPVQDKARALLEQLAAEAAGEAERHAARKLGADPERVALAARVLWDHSLTEERDRLVAERAPETLGRGVQFVHGRRLQAVRGHVTRQLLEELAEQLEQLEPVDIYTAAGLEDLGGEVLEQFDAQMADLDVVDALALLAAATRSELGLQEDSGREAAG